MLEVLVSMAVLTAGIAAFLRSTISSNRMNAATEQVALASLAASQMLQELESQAFEEVFARYNSSQADDPATGSSPGAEFAVDSLRSADGSSGVGRIVFPTDGAGGLVEHEVLTGLGRAFDLDQDGAIDKDTHSLDYKVLPVEITVTWGAGTPRTFRLASVLIDA